MKEGENDFFDGGIRGFFNDLYYRTIEKGYKVTHPRCWNIDISAGTSSRIKINQQKIWWKPMKRL